MKGVSRPPACEIETRLSNLSNMGLWIVFGIVVTAVAIVYFWLPKKKPTIDIKKFPRKYPDEKVS